ncbi:Uu.00g051490.m01.CDS01 [Anthostomella pinea]|uniref:Uu.00g051490.m01.CDS01 n=1 Tax=Anthostomella pinea TaxID=933095 RepID=A0AAI8VSV4_9PEZI|nr:Uu.00g051490.m01.CDS01 [Anthostomella pinea]
MAPSNGNRVRELRDRIEHSSWGSLNQASTACSERELEVIEKGLCSRVSELDQRLQKSTRSSTTSTSGPRSGTHAHQNIRDSDDASSDSDGENGDNATQCVEQRQQEPPQQIVQPDSDLERREQELGSAQKNSADISAAHYECQREIRSLKDKIRALQEKNVCLKEAGADQKLLIKETKDEIDELRKQLDDSNARERELTRELHDAQRAERKLKEELDAAHDQSAERGRDYAGKPKELESGELFRLVSRPHTGEGATPEQAEPPWFLENASTRGSYTAFVQGSDTSKSNCYQKQEHGKSHQEAPGNDRRHQEFRKGHEKQRAPKSRKHRAQVTGLRRSRVDPSTVELMIATAT